MLQNANSSLCSTVIKSPQKSSVIQQSPSYSSHKYKMGIIKSESVENEENTTTDRCKEGPSNDQQYIPSTSSSGMRIITYIPHFVLNAHPGLHD